MMSSRSFLWIPLTLCLLHHVLFGVAASSQAELEHDGKLTGEGKTNAGRARRASSFVRIGKPSNFVRIGRPSSFVRIGKDVGNDDGALGEEFEEYDPLEKRPSNFVRFGKRNMHRFIRIGRLADSQSYEDPYGELDKRASKFVRIGKSESYPEDEDNDVYDKRASQFVRIGKAAGSDRIDVLPEILKRASSFVRIGKSPSSFVRIGRGPTGYEFPEDDVDKRTNSFVRIGKSYGDDDYPSPYGFESQSDLKQAASNLIRIGQQLTDDKRASSFVRIGKNVDNLEDEDEDNDDKRASSFVRIGKSDQDKRLSSLIEMNKAPASTDNLSSSSSSSSSKSSPSSPKLAQSTEDLEDGGVLTQDRPINLANRGSAFVRIGKIPSSAFVRIGKNTNVLMDPIPESSLPYRRGSRGGQSNFVRIG